MYLEDIGDGRSMEPGMELREDDKRELLRFAREVVEAELSGKQAPELSHATPLFEAAFGVFVTLWMDSELRGCIGYVEPRTPLRSAVEEVARKAALEDPRFLPITPAELRRTMIEISVLSPLEEVKEISGIEVGKHGLVVDAGHARGLLLPQVPTEYGWDREQFLIHTCQKAGLPPDAWKQPHVKLFVFTTTTFSE